MNGIRVVLSMMTLGAALAVAWPQSAEARVTKITITQIESPTYTGESFGNVGQYERLVGTAAGEIDPQDRHNEIIQDIQFAPRNARGNVEYVATFTLVKPIDLSRGNATLLYEVVNRGNKQLSAFNVGGTSGNDFASAGDGFFQHQGYTILWSGWQGDVIPDASRETIEVPIAKNPDGSPITGPVLGRFVNVSGNTSQIIVFNAPIAYQPLTLDPSKATLTMNAPETIDGVIPGPVTTIPSSDWAWADCRTVPFPGISDPTRVCLKDGFDPTKVYTLVYTGKDPLVLGVGLAATRDIVSFFRHAQADDTGSPNPVANRLSYVLGQGTSQSGNFVKTFIHLGFNEDEDGRIVFEGVNPNIAARQNPLNYRFANPGGDASLYSPGSEPVLWWREWPDVLRDRPTAGLLDRCRASHTCPKIFETMTSAEFWDLRMSPGLVGTDAKRDIPLPKNVRRYYYPSTTHGGGGGGFTTALGSPTAGPAGPCLLPANPNPTREQQRALFVALHDWTVHGVNPPPSRYPRLRDKTLVPATTAALGFPSIPGVPLPDGLVNTVLEYDFGPDLIYNDLSGIISIQPPIIKQKIPTFVPKVDGDGNEVAGVKSVLAQAPLATYLGWNVATSGAYAGQICSFIGGAKALALRKAEREANGDPRLSLEERYGSQEGYNCAVARAAARLVRQRFLLLADADRLITQARASNVLSSDPANSLAEKLCRARHDGHEDDDSPHDDQHDD
jgi:hypothetical protein